MIDVSHVRLWERNAITCVNNSELAFYPAGLLRDGIVPGELDAEPPVSLEALFTRAFLASKTSVTFFLSSTSNSNKNGTAKIGKNISNIFHLFWHSKVRFFGKCMFRFCPKFLRLFLIVFRKTKKKVNFVFYLPIISLVVWLNLPSSLISL